MERTLVVILKLLPTSVHRLILSLYWYCACARRYIERFIGHGLVEARPVPRRSVQPSHGEEAG